MSSTRNHQPQQNVPMPEPIFEGFLGECPLVYTRKVCNYIGIRWPPNLSDDPLDPTNRTFSYVFRHGLTGRAQEWFMNLPWESQQMPILRDKFVGYYNSHAWIGRTLGQSSRLAQQHIVQRERREAEHRAAAEDDTTSGDEDADVETFEVALPNTFTSMLKRVRKLEEHESDVKRMMNQFKDYVYLTNRLTDRVLTLESMLQKLLPEEQEEEEADEPVHTPSPVESPVETPDQADNSTDNNSTETNDDINQI